jgi:hypothetical protein
VRSSSASEVKEPVKFETTINVIAPGSGPEKQELLRLIGTLTRGS